MNRPHPFDWRNKRRGSGQGADPYDQYFRDEVDFPHFGSTWDAFHRAGNKRSQHPSETNDRSGFFDYLPPEFRQYMPDNFGFGSGMRNHPSAHHSSAQQQHPSQQYHQQQPPPQQQQQPQQQQAQQPNPEQNNSRSNLCDAAIQTEDLSANNNNDQNNDRSNNGPNQNRQNNAGNGPQFSNSSSSSSSYSTPQGNQVHMSTSANGPGAFASAAAGNGPNQYYQQSPNQQYYQQQNPYAGPYTHSAPQPNQFHYQQQQPPPPPPPPSNQGDNFVRHVPIFFEGSNVPVTQTTSTQATSPPTRPRPEPFQSREAFHQTQQPPQQQESQPPQQESQPDAPPQTPHTADCIAKIQAIQRDVLDLMCAVEQFGGKRGDKEYSYLDEMLTRNLLKLDTIDTNGKDSIRMARKEAIKCIQASIAVLEAKADLHLNANKDTEGEANTAANTETTDTNNPSTGEEKVAENSDGNKDSNGQTSDPKPDEPMQVEESAKEGENENKSSEAEKAGKGVDVPNAQETAKSANE